MTNSHGGDLEELPVVLLHGTSGKSEDWSQVVEQLASHRSVIRPNYAEPVAGTDEVEQERFLGVSGAIEHVQFVVRMGDNFLLVVFRFLVLLKQFGDAELFEENAYVSDPVRQRALGVTVLA